MDERKLLKSVFKYLNVIYYFNFLYLFFCWNFLRTIVIWKIQRKSTERERGLVDLEDTNCCSISFLEERSSFFSILLIWTFCPHTFYEAYLFFFSLNHALLIFIFPFFLLVSLLLQSIDKLQMKLRSEGGIKALLGIVRCGHPDVLSQVARGIANFAKCESRGSTQGTSLN